MPPSPPPSPPNPEDERRRSIYAELSNYLTDLKQRAATPGSDPATDEDGCAISFPENFEDVVGMMSRSDSRATTLTVDDAIDHSGPPTTGGPTTNDSVDWSKFALSEGLSKIGIYNQYENELKRDASDRERMERALAKVTLLDRKISVRESEHGATLDGYKQEIEELQREVNYYNTEYEEQYGQKPAGEKGQTKLNTSSPSAPPPLDDYDPPMSARSVASTATLGSRGGRFFVTDKLRKNTPRSGTAGSDTARSEVSSVSEMEGLKAGRKMGGYDEDYYGYEEAKDDLSPNKRRSVVEGGKLSAAERNMQLAGRAGQSSLTVEEEARIRLLLGPDAEGDTDEFGNGGVNNEEEKEREEDELMAMVYGGKKERVRIKEIDDQLKEMGVLDLLEGGEESPVAGSEKGEGVLRARAKARAEKEKERTIDETLKAIKSAGYSIVVEDGEEGGAVEDPLAQPIRREDIKALYEDVGADLKEEGVELADKCDIKVLLSKLDGALQAQTKAREKSQSGKRQEVEEVIKKYGDDIGELYQSQWEGDGEFDDVDGEEEEEKGEEKEKEKQKMKGGEFDKENETVERNVRVLGMDMMAAQEKIMASMERAEAAAKQARVAQDDFA